MELARKKIRSVAEEKGGGKNERSVVVQVFVVFGGGFCLWHVYVSCWRGSERRRMRDCEWFKGFLGGNFLIVFWSVRKKMESRNGIEVVRFQWCGSREDRDVGFFFFLWRRRR